MTVADLPAGGGLMDLYFKYRINGGNFRGNCKILIT